MHRAATSTLFALLGVAAIAWATARFLPLVGLASAALLFLLPVLVAAVRGGTGPALAAALAGAAAYNFLLLPPRYSFRITGPDNLVSLFVLVVVALVTSRLASLLRAREAEATARAHASGEAAELSAILGAAPAQGALARGLEWMAARHGAVQLLDVAALPAGDAAFSPLDLAAAAWAVHNGDVTGHATEVMPAAEWSFLPLAAKNRRDGHVAALARPADGTTRPAAEVEHLARLCLLLGQCRDRDALEAERQARERLEESDRLRRTMLASLAHDFRTPLTVITGRLAMLAGASADAADALAAARRLEHMMADLIGAARIEGGELVPAPESVDLVDVAAAACDDLAAPGGIAISRDIPAALPFVSADPVLLRHIMVNLIDNALRHAAARVALSAQAAADGGVRIIVDDDGPGVPPADRAAIFERFARLEGSDRRNGSGLGLAIVHGFAQAMGMTVSVDASPMGGARFTLAMPAAGAARG